MKTSQTDAKRSRPRLLEIDIAKGVACFLMLAPHFLGGAMPLPGTFAAPLFFSLSGMSSSLMFKSSREGKTHYLFHAVFPLLLFFGGITQIGIAHSGMFRIIPEFMQFLALSMLLALPLCGRRENHFRIGLLFPIPFIGFWLLGPAIIPHSDGTPLSFLISENFAIFPRFGYFLFGILLLHVPARRYLLLALPLLAGASLSFFLLGIPVDREHTSISYVLLALLVITLLFRAAIWLRSIPRGWLSAAVINFFTISGRNSLMFIYLHYLAIRYFLTADLSPNFLVATILESFYLYLICIILIMLYERIKYDTGLLFPLLFLALLAGIARFSGLLRTAEMLRFCELLLGLVFAFSYVQFRYLVRPLLLRKDPA
jgi:hypothetical protein